MVGKVGGLWENKLCNPGGSNCNDCQLLSSRKDTGDDDFTPKKEGRK